MDRHPEPRSLRRAGRPAGGLLPLRQAQGLRHVSEYLAAAAAVCRPQSPRSWLHTQQKRLRRGAPLPVLAAMEPFAEPASEAGADPPVRAAIRYLRHRLQCLDYPKAISRDLPIGPFGRLRAFGSGLIESGHKHVLQARLKKAGCAWLPANADALAQLRVLRANQQWDHYWLAHRAA